MTVILKGHEKFSMSSRSKSTELKYFFEFFTADGEMGRWGDGEMGRWGDGEMLQAKAWK
ncbi:MAG: hypothetical protein AAF633_06665 [Chloroflexota bacterium]